jgi:hypothetical protein
MADSGEGRRVCGMPEKAQLHVAMLLLQFGYAGFHVVSRLALNMGISKLVFPVYRNIIALCLLVPFAYFLEKYASRLAGMMHMHALCCVVLCSLMMMMCMQCMNCLLQEGQAAADPQLRRPVLPSRALRVRMHAPHDHA